MLEGFYGEEWEEGSKALRHPFLGDDIKSCISTIPPTMRCQLNNLLTKKRMEKEIIIGRIIIQNDCVCMCVNQSLGCVI